jgi:hypothetical protein
MNIKYINYSEWVDTYKPTTNIHSKNDDKIYETFGADMAVVNETDYHYVWTEMDGDEPVIVSGRAFVNRLHYYITEVPWQDEEDIEVHDPDYTAEIVTLMDEDYSCIVCEELSK